MKSLEIAHLKLRYRALRIPDPVRRGRLANSIATHGQLTPVVVHGGTSPYTLVDGYRRVEALRSLGEDFVTAFVLETDLAQALALSLRFQRTRKVSALEQAWLIRELRDEGWGRAEIALQLERSPSWVSRRLSLIDILPASVQEAIRKGKVSSQAAEKSLVPMARANADHCTRLVAALGSHRASVRELQKIYEGWRRADPTVRERIVSAPLLWLKVSEPHFPRATHLQAQLLERLHQQCRQCLDALSEDDGSSPIPASSDFFNAWTKVCSRFERLTERMERLYARSRYSDGHPSAG